MLNAIRSALVASGVLAAGAPLPPFAARMSGNLVLRVGVSERMSLVVKVEVAGGLDREQAGLQAGHQALPRQVPEPLTLGTHCGSRVMVMRWVDHVPLGNAVAANEAIVVDGVMTYLAAAREHFRIATSAGRTEALAEDIFRAAARAGRRDARELARSEANDLASLPCVRQHGDFVRNNLGIADGVLVIFDWEDFGRVDVAGFDLATLALSLCDFDARALVDARGPGAIGRRIVERAAPAIGLAPQRFLAHLPGYLALFAQAKSSGGYDPSVAGRALAALAAWESRP